jgi:hypothetical protein
VSPAGTGGTPIDVGNPLLAPGPSRLYLARVRLPDGPERMVLTVRTTSATLTWYLDREQGLMWADMIRAKAETLSVLAAGNGQAPG